ncbi:tRNA-splicing endonuclease subunit Sen2 [Geosmithia morbida]|uniref:tRNA-intron lyase n=1 Tax=Geosmithia morbida TaxID=1094350 RepID=A0A9P5CZP4_9HYPO|nr:tRNA-splicing endonuclease subunit Sen2 [Geosmithia morbida]KAF4120737.1 tRNA-splicing endonuclease subunit Sen2 [Geosmithia morbida]
MASTTKATSTSTPNRPNAQKRSSPPLNQIYALPAPIRTFPLPTFYPNNPVSLFYVAYAWLGQLLRPPPAEPAVVHEGTWSEATCSVHITDDKSVRALWEQGFYGKGSLSRSEPNWLKREQVRRGHGETHVSEILTVQRREERLRAKWERARLEQEVIRQTREAEALEAERRRSAQNTSKPIIPNPIPIPKVIPKATPKLARKLTREARPKEHYTFPSMPAAPTGPIQLLALPNSLVELLQISPPPSQPTRLTPTPAPPIGPMELLALPNSVAELELLHMPPPLAPAPPTGPAELLALPNSVADLVHPSIEPVEDEIEVDGIDVPVHGGGLGIHTNGSADLHPNGGTSNGSTSVYLNGSAEKLVKDVVGDDDTVVRVTANGSAPIPTVIPGLHKLKAQKSVRFSPEVESTSFKVSDPPSPDRTGSGQKQESGKGHDPVATLVNKEHLQLMPEEALWLSFGLGALTVKDPSSGQPLSNRDLLTLFRQHSYFPPRTGPDDPDLQPDDDFLVHYAVYHHFRSLGWVPRAGIKFGVDWLLYTRGPVFDHAEFGLVVVPSYSDPLWSTASGISSRKNKTPQTWHGLHSVIRVLSQVMKSLVLVYVDVPPRAKLEAALDSGGLAHALRLYRVREMMVKRWSSNRNR